MNGILEILFLLDDRWAQGRPLGSRVQESGDSYANTGVLASLLEILSTGGIADMAKVWFGVVS